MRHPVVIVEGLIGSGKSTLSVELGKALGENCLVQLEPDEKNNANPYLAMFYEDMRRWGFTLQINQLALRYRMHLRAQWHAMSGGGPAILDRSFYGDTCFARMLNKMGHIDDNEFQTYKQIYQAMTASVLLPNVCVRVLVSPSVSNDRIAARYSKREGRECESAIDLQYLRNLDVEISHTVDVLRKQGVNVIDMPWDVDRDSEEDRHIAVMSLAERIKEYRPVDVFLDMHRRTV